MDGTVEAVAIGGGDRCGDVKMSMTPHAASVVIIVI